MYKVLMFQENALNRLGFKIFMNNQKRLSNVSSEGLIICVKHKWENHVHYYDMSCQFVMWLRVTVDGNNDLLPGSLDKVSHLVEYIHYLVIDHYYHQQ